MNIITAIGNPIINEELKKNNKFNIIGKDILYKEGILEILEEYKNIDIIIVSDQIDGKIELSDLINRIYIINKKIKIILIYKNKYLDEKYNNKNLLYIHKNEMTFSKLSKLICQVGDLKKLNKKDKQIINKEKNDINVSNKKTKSKRVDNIRAKKLFNILKLNKIKKEENIKIEIDIKIRKV